MAKCVCLKAGELIHQNVFRHQNFIVCKFTSAQEFVSFKHVHLQIFAFKSHFYLHYQYIAFFTLERADWCKRYWTTFGYCNCLCIWNKFVTVPWKETFLGNNFYFWNKRKFFLWEKFYKILKRLSRCERSEKREGGEKK